jgi:hypothetical protein
MGGDPGHDGVVGDVGHDDRSRTDHDPRPDADAGEHPRPGSHERPLADLGRAEQHRRGRDVAALADHDVVLDDGGGVDHDGATQPGRGADVCVLEDDGTVAEGRRPGDGGGRRDEGRQRETTRNGPLQQAGTTRVVTDAEGDAGSGAGHQRRELVVVEHRDVPGGTSWVPAHGDDRGAAADEDVVENPGVPTCSDEGPRRDVRPPPI